MGHTFQRVFGFFGDPFINRESATGFKRVLLEIYGGVLGIILLASFFALSGVLNSMCPVPKAATSTNLVVARRCWCVTKVATRYTMSYCDGDLYKRLKAEGRLNLLFRLSEPCASWLQNDRVSAGARPNVISFISRAQHLAWRELWKRGRFVRLSWTAEQRAALVRQDEIFRDADREWERKHSKRDGPAVVAPFPAGSDYDFLAEELKRLRSEGESEHQ